MQKIRKAIESYPPPKYNHKMKSIAFIDTEIELRSRRILDIGGVRDNGAVFHNGSVPDFVSFVRGSQFVCGHNIINHDAKYIGHALNSAGIAPAAIIDTFFPLCFFRQSPIMRY